VGAEAAARADPVRLLLLSADPLARSGLLALVAADTLTVVGEGAPHEASALAATFDPDVVLWDLGLAPSADVGRAGPAAAGVPVLALVADDEQAVQARAAGASGILQRDSGAARLIAAVRAVAAGLTVLDEPSAAALIRPSAAPAGPVEPLTPREQEVLQLLAEGLSNKEIALRLGISEHTAKFHVAKLLQKLGALSRSEAVFIGVRLGLLLV
jgi:DNA-binding NarL/FixJ family response regulator